MSKRVLVYIAGASLTLFAMSFAAVAEEFTPPRNNWAWEHLSAPGQPALKPLPKPRTRPVTAEDPINVDVFYSMRSPYSYLSLDRLLYLNSNYNVDMNIRTIFPVAVRMPGKFTGSWYWYGYLMIDTERVADYQGIPYHYPNPDPIKQDTRWASRTAA